MALPDSLDLVPDSDAPTDVAPLGRMGGKPAHERTAAEEKEGADWDAIAADQDFKRLLASKARFVAPATAFFIVYYFALPILVGWFPGAMKQKVLGELNWAYLFALSQFFMAWILASLYVAAAMGWDRQVAALLAKFSKDRP